MKATESTLDDLSRGRCHGEAQLGAATWTDESGGLVEQPEASGMQPWQEGSVAERYAIRSFHGVTLIERSLEETAEVLTGSLGFEAIDSSGARHRFRAPNTESAAVVDVVVRPDEGFGRVAVGSVHHVAFRIAGDQEQESWRRRALDRGLQVTTMRDRTYFHSLYFREPGGVLFEIATDPPGFSVDENVAELGSSLRLPAWLESERETLQATLPELTVPSVEVLAS